MQKQILKILRWSEKYTGTDMVYLAGNGSWILLAQGVASVSAFVVTVLLTNLLPKEIFGQYRFILSVIPILAIFTLPGIGAALTRSIARSADTNLHIIVKTKIKFGLLGSLSALLCALYYFYKDNELLAYAFLVSSVFIPFFETFFIYSFYYKGLQNFKTPAIYESVSRILQTLIMIAAVLLTKDIIALIAAFFIGQIVTRFFFYFRTLRSETYLTNLIFKNKNEIEDDTIEYGKKLSVIGIAGTIANNMDKLLVWHFLGAEALAVYVAAFAIPSQLIRIFGYMATLVEAKFASRHWNSQETILFITKLIKIAVVMVVPVILYILLAPTIFKIIFPKYMDAVYVTQVLALLIPLAPINTLIIANLRAQKHTLHILLIAILNISIFAITFLYTYATFGIMGAAIAYLITQIFVIVFWLISNKIRLC